MPTNSQLYGIPSSQASADDVDAASNSGDNVACTCPNQLSHWDESGNVHPDLPSHCMISVRLERGESADKIMTAATAGNPAHSSASPEGQRAPSSGPQRQSNRIKALQAAGRMSNSGASTWKTRRRRRDPPVSPALMPPAPGSPAQVSPEHAVKQEGVLVQPAPVVAPVPVLVVAPVPIIAPAPVAAPAPVIAPVPVSVIAPPPVAAPPPNVAAAPAVVHDIFNPIANNADPPAYDNAIPDPLFEANNNAGWFQQAMENAVGDDPAEAPGAQVAQIPVNNDDTIVNKSEFRVTDCVKKRKVGNTTTTVYLKEVKKSILFIRNKPYGSTRVNVVCNFNE